MFQFNSFVYNYINLCEGLKSVGLGSHLVLIYYLWALAVLRDRNHPISQQQECQCQCRWCGYWNLFKLNNSVNGQSKKCFSPKNISKICSISVFIPQLWLVVSVLCIRRDWWYVFLWHQSHCLPPLQTWKYSYKVIISTKC